MSLSSLFGYDGEILGETVSTGQQNLLSLADESSEQIDPFLRKIKEFETVRPKVDFSDFKNFVFFNSALDYFNITAEKIVGEYPSAGSDDEIQIFFDSLDDYQRHVIDVWPKTSFKSLDSTVHNVHVKIPGVGKNGNVESNLLNFGPNSFSVEMWIQLPNDSDPDIRTIFHRSSGTQGTTIQFHDGGVSFHVYSGSSEFSTFTPAVGTNYFCFTADKENEELRIYRGSSNDFPVIVSSSSFPASINVDAGIEPAFIFTGSIPGSTGSYSSHVEAVIDDLRIWNVVRSENSIKKTFNTVVNAQSGLISSLRFNDQDTNQEYVRDSSGCGIYGIINGDLSSRSPVGLIPNDVSDIITNVEDLTLSNFIGENQLSGTLYDRDNDNSILRLLPEQFFLLEEQKGTTVLQDFLFVIGRFFDSIKIRIDQFSNVLRVDYGDYDQAPDALLADVGAFFGWEFTGNFLDKDVIQYVIGKNILPDGNANRSIETKLWEIKNEFWRRTLTNLSHLYKTKGTRESVESLIRIYGVDENLVKLKEHGFFRRTGISTNRIHSGKSSFSLIMSGSSLEADPIEIVDRNSFPVTSELNVRFPTGNDSTIPASLINGQIFSYGIPGNSESVFFTRDSLTGSTGKITYECDDFSFELNNLEIFDGEWTNIFVTRDIDRSTTKLDVIRLDTNEIKFHASASVNQIAAITTGSSNFYTASIGSSSYENEMYVSEWRDWSIALSDVDKQDHTLNFMSYGTEKSDSEKRIIHVRLDENISPGPVDTLVGSVVFSSSFGEYSKKSFRDFNFIANPEYGWSEDKIRLFDDSRIPFNQAEDGSSLVSLEFNLIDSLNKDMSQIVSSLEEFNSYIGSPNGIYQDSYQELDGVRAKYFNDLKGKINFTKFVDLIEFFDRSFITMVRKLIPARAFFIGDEIVVESHMLERSKVQVLPRRGKDILDLEGRIQFVSRFYEVDFSGS